MSFWDPECLTDAEEAFAEAAFFLDPRRGPVWRTRRMSCLWRPVAGGAGGSGEDWPEELGEPGRSRLMAVSMDGTATRPEYAAAADPTSAVGPIGRSTGEAAAAPTGEGKQKERKILPAGAVPRMRHVSTREIAAVSG